jgi:[ribosomal protein S18]-alanine N-acetyltransferase
VTVDIRRAGAGTEAEVRAAEALFDDPVDLEAARRFIASDANVLLIAYADGAPAGFVSGTELSHPDKPAPEMFLNELAVDEAFRSRGIGRALASELWRVAQTRGCRGMWVLTDVGNAPANRVYSAAGGMRVGAQLMYQWGES